MIKSFKHSGLEKFYETDSKAGIIPAHAKKLRDVEIVDYQDYH
jgi:proteic killer suppression protein